MKIQNILLLIFISFNTLNAKTIEKSLLKVDFLPTKSMQQIKDDLAQNTSISSLVSFINHEFKISPKGGINVKFIDNQKDTGPYADIKNKTIFIPYQFIFQTNQLFKKSNYKKQTGIDSKMATNDALLHTILHEITHLMIYVYDLPIVSKEEDVADNLATFILTQHFENGQEISISAADLFDIERQADDISESNYWDEHSLDAQRFYSILCIVYGSDPNKYSTLLKELNIDENRQDMCIDEYEKMTKSWKKILKPWIKK